MPVLNPYVTYCATSMQPDILPVEFYENARRNYSTRNLADNYVCLDILKPVSCGYCNQQNIRINLYCEFCGAPIDHA